MFLMSRKDHYKRFCKNTKCSIKDSERKHHKLLHLTNTYDQSKTPQREHPQTNTASLVPSRHKDATALPVVAIKVYGAESRGITTYALLDQASEASFIHSSLARKLNLKGTKGKL
jgi:hypothetical protein